MDYLKIILEEIRSDLKEMKHDIRDLQSFKAKALGMAGLGAFLATLFVSIAAELIKK